MSKISTYSTVTPAAGDKVIGTDVAGTPTDATKNFLVEDIAALAGSQGLVTLSQVLDAGNTATNSITLTGNITTTGLVAPGTVLLGTAAGASVICNSVIAAQGGITVSQGQTAQVAGTLQLTPTSVLDALSGSELKAVLPSHADNAAAVLAGLAAGRIYRTTGTGAAPLDAPGIVMVVV